MSPEKAIKNNEDDRSPASQLSHIEIADSHRPRSRMQINKKEVQKH